MAKEVCETNFSSGIFSAKGRDQAVGQHGRNRSRSITVEWSLPAPDRSWQGRKTSTPQAQICYKSKATSYAMKLGKTDATTFGGQFGLFLLMFFLAGTSAAQNCGGTERWGPKDGTDQQAANIDLTNITPATVADLLAIHQPQFPSQGDNTTRIVPDETHVYRVQARLVKWGHESDDDYHLVLTDDTLKYTDETAHPPIPPTGHSFIGEVPDPSCFSGSDGSFGSQTPFADGIISARQTMDHRFPNADQSGKWNDGAGAPVEITGIGFFDRPHGQLGRAPNNIEIHPILSIRFLDQPNPSTSRTVSPTPQPLPTGGQWEYQMISAADATSLLNQANTQGTQGWELAGIVVDTNRSDKYVGFLKRKKQ